MKHKILLVFIMLVMAAPLAAQKKKKKAQEPPQPPAVVEVVQPAIPPPVKVTSVEGITEYKLPNGLRVLLFPDQTKQTITVNITYLVGSKHENYGETGMAHLLEHLVFKGTPNHPNIPQELTEHGASPNGTTWFDRTNYFETFNATEENLKWALDLEADRMVNSFIAKKDLDSEMTVVRNEFESGENSPFRVLYQRMLSAGYEWHNYGKSTIGARADIENGPIDRLQAFYKKNYQPDNAVLVVAGKIDEEKTLALVNDYFGVIPRPERTLPTYYTRDPVQDGERMVTVRRVGDVQWAGVGYKVSAGSHPDYAAISIISEVLGATPSGRMYKALIDTKKASTTSTWDFQLKEPGMIASFAQVLKDKSLDEVRKSMIKVYDDLATSPPTQEEVDRAKTKLLKDNELFFNSSEDIGLALSEYIGMGDWRMLFLHRDRVMNTTVEDVARVAKYYFKPDNRTVGLFIPVENPDRAEIPADPDVEALVKDYKGRQNIAIGEEFDPTPANIDARTIKSALPNGMKVAYLAKKTRGESVQLNMTLRFGDEASLKNKGKAGSYAANLLDKGTTKMTRQQIQDEFNRLKAEVRFFGSASAVSASVETTRPNLPEVLRLVGQILREPAFPADEFDKLKNQQIASIESQRREPTSVAIMRIQKYLSPYTKEDTRYVEDFDESIAAINAQKLDDIKKFHKDFYGTNNGTLAIAGDFNVDEIQPLVIDLFGSWKSPANYKRLDGKLKKVTPINEAIETPDKPNAFFIALQQIEMRDNHPDYAALTLGHYILGGGFLNSRLATRIRQKEGLSYGVGSSFSAAPIDNIGTFQAYAIYAPENVEKLEIAFNEELNKVITEGFTDEEVTAAKSGWLQSRTVNRAQDQYLANTLNGHLFLNRSFNWDETMEKKIESLTAAQINEAMKKHLDPKDISMVKAGDFAKSKEEGK